MAQDPEREAISQLRGRDPRGFDWAYATYAGRVHGFLLRLSGRRDVADDLLQHTFLRLAEHGPELRSDSNLRAWLFGVARNAYVSRQRGRVHERGEVGPEALASPEPALEARLLLGDVEQALGALRLEDRELLLLVGVEGLAPNEAAALLDIHPAALRQRLSRARSRLLAELERQPRRARLERSGS